MKIFKDIKERMNYILNHRLTKKCSNEIKGDYYTEVDKLTIDDEQLLIDKLGMFEDAEAANKIFFFPIGIGDTVYYLYDNNTKITTDEITEIIIHPDKIAFRGRWHGGKILYLSELGITWFLSETDAKTQTAINAFVVVNSELSQKRRTSL